MSPRGAGTRERAAAAALRLLEERGPSGLTMRALAQEVGVRAPSLYKHYPDKRSLEAAIITIGLREFGARLDAATGRGEEPVAALAAAYRRFALDRPHLYRLMNDGPLPRDLLPPGLEDAVAHPLLRVFGGRDRARAAWGAAHGLASLELAGRFPEGADVDAAWAAIVGALRATNPPMPPA